MTKILMISLCWMHATLQGYCGAIWTRQSSPDREKSGKPIPKMVHDVVQRCGLATGIFVLVLDTRAGICCQNRAKKVHWSAVASYSCRFFFLLQPRTPLWHPILVQKCDAMYVGSLTPGVCIKSARIVVNRRLGARGSILYTLQVAQWTHFTWHACPWKNYSWGCQVST